MEFKIQQAESHHRDAVLKLLPRLADFPIPKERKPEEFWQGDAVLVKQHFDEKNRDTRIWIAVDETDHILGTLLLRFNQDPLNEQTNAHVEVLAVSEQAEGNGVASQLLEMAEAETRKQQAFSLSLNVFSNNERARSLYQKFGFDEEMIRCIKRFWEIHPDLRLSPIGSIPINVKWK